MAIKSRRMRWEGHVARVEEKTRCACRDLVGMPEKRSPLGRPRCRWKDNIIMDLKEVVSGRVDWIDLVQDRDKWWAVV
jgi:hypothetical protein